MIDQEKYVKVITNPLEKQSAAMPTANNVDATFTENGIYTAPEPYTGFGVVTVDVPEKVIESITVTPTTSEQTISGGGGVDGYAPITVNAVTSSIDSNIQPQNIVEGKSILGVAGTAPAVSYPYRQLSVDNGTLTISNTSPNPGFFSGNASFSRIGEYALMYAFSRATINTQTWTGVTTVDGEHALKNAYYYANINKVSFTNMTSITGNECFEYAFYGATVSDKIEFPALVELYGSGLQKFLRAFNFMVGNVSFPNLKTVSGGTYAFSYAFSGMNGTVDLSSLESVTTNYAFENAFAGELNTITQQTFSPSITGLFNTLKTIDLCMYSFNYAFYGNTNLVNVSFSVLETVTGNYTFRAAFANCTNLQTLSFPALKSTSFGNSTNQFTNMLYGCTDVVVHFPSNLQSVIGTWTAVTNGFGGTNTTVLFDLPATE